MADVKPFTSFAFTEDVKYGYGELTGGWADLVMDTYIPHDWQEGYGFYPAVILIPGGGFGTTNKSDDNMTHIAKYMARRGYAVFLMDHRTANTNLVLPPAITVDSRFNFTDPTDFVSPLAEKTCRYAAAVDLKRCIRHVRANAASYGVDPYKIGLWGVSSGAATASLVACSDSDWYVVDDPATQAVSDANEADNNHGASTAVDCGVLWWGRHDSTLTTIGSNPTEKQSADDPPFLIIHGDSDGTVDYAYSEDFSKSLQAVGNTKSTFLTMVGEDHAPENAGGTAYEFFFPDGVELHQKSREFFANYAATNAVEEESIYVTRLVNIRAGGPTVGVSDWIKNPGRLVGLKFFDDDADWAAANGGEAIRINGSTDCGETGGQYQGRIYTLSGDDVTVKMFDGIGASYGEIAGGHTAGGPVRGGVTAPWVRLENVTAGETAHTVGLVFEKRPA